MKPHIGESKLRYVHKDQEHTFCKNTHFRDFETSHCCATTLKSSIINNMIISLKFAAKFFCDTLLQVTTFLSSRVQVILHFFTLLNLWLPIVRAFKTLNSYCCVDYMCFIMVRWTFRNLASVLGNVRFETLLIIVAMGVNHVVGAHKQLG